MPNPHEPVRFRDVDIRCPVCRARQKLQPSCRRCSADLSLLMRVIQRIEYVKHQREIARASDDTLMEQTLTAELRQLSPRE